MAEDINASFEKTEDKEIVEDMDDTSKLYALSNLYNQLRPLSQRVNEIHQELLHFKRCLSESLPQTVVGSKRNRVMYQNDSPPTKK